MTTEQVRLTQFSKGGGCGCKIAPSVLNQILGNRSNDTYPALLVGNESNDDAAAWQIDGDTAVISTTDFFMPIVDDSFDFGRIASANAISDVYAMGGTPLMAIAILGWPVDKIPVSEAQRVLEGARAICKEAGIPLAGGHTIDSTDPIFGLAVTGRADLKHLKRNNGARPGDVLFLTKPIGVGMMATAMKRNVLSEKHYAPLVKQLSTLNSIGADLGRIEGVHAMTDVTGFGVLGHSTEMAEGSGVTIELHYSKLRKTVGVDEYLQKKTFPGATPRNWNSYSRGVQFEEGVNVDEALNLLPDPQTNGGLLIAVAPEAVEEVKALFIRKGLEQHTTPIGICREKGDKTIIVAP
jgi:selenide, water dikinase